MAVNHHHGVTRIKHRLTQTVGSLMATKINTEAGGMLHLNNNCAFDPSAH